MSYACFGKKPSDTLITNASVKMIHLSAETENHAAADAWYAEGLENTLKPEATHTIINQIGTLPAHSYVVCNNVPVLADKQPQFEERFLQRAGKVEKEPGFEAIRILKPIHSDVNVIITFWRDASFFTDWQESSAYKEAHKHRNTKQGLSKSIFSRPSYVEYYNGIVHPDGRSDD